MIVLVSNYNKITIMSNNTVLRKIYICANRVQICSKHMLIFPGVRFLRCFLQLYHTSNSLNCNVSYKNRSKVVLSKARYLNTKMIIGLNERCQHQQNVNIDVLKTIAAVGRHKDDNKHVELYKLECDLAEKLEKSEINIETALDAAGQFLHYEYRQGRFLSSIFKTCNENFHAVNQPDLVTKLMFYIYLHGFVPGGLTVKVENYMNENFEQFHINDVGFVCLGFFRTMSRFQCFDLINKIKHRLLIDLDAVSDDHLCNILKSLRYSLILNPSFYDDLTKQLIKTRRISKIRNYQTLMQITSFYAGSLVYDESLFDKLLHHFKQLLQNRTNQRPKDISRLIWACGQVQHKPKENRKLYLEFVELFKKAYNNKISERRGYKVHKEVQLADFLIGMAYLEIFPYDLLQIIFNFDVVNKLLAENKFNEKNYQLYFLHFTVSIECPDFKTQILTQDNLAFLMKKRSDVSVDFALEYNPRLACFYQTLQDMLGPNHVHCHHVLPHFGTADIEIQFSEDGLSKAFIPVPYKSKVNLRSSLHPLLESDVISALSLGFAKRTDVKRQSDMMARENKKVLIQILSKEAFLRNTHELTGHYVTKLRQLQKLGYTTLLVSTNDAVNFITMTVEERKEYIRKRFLDDLHIDLEDKKQILDKNDNIIK